MHHAQISHGRCDHDDRCHHQDRHTGRVGGEAFEGLRRDDGAEQDADDDVADAGQPDRHLDRTPEQRGDGDREDRSGHEAGRKTQ